MKKKIIAICLVAVIAVTAVVGASLAYLTDTDSADNVFTVGNVKIELIEQQRKLDDDGNKTTELEDFEDGKVLLPIVGSAQGVKDSLGIPTAANYVDKIVTVKNTGASDAYVRVLVAVPASLDYPDGPLHWNLGNKYNDATDDTFNEEVVWKFVNKESVNGVECNIYSFTYQTALKGASDAVTPFAAIVGFYLDKSVDNEIDENDNITYTYEGKTINYDLTKGVTIPVFAQAVQSAGFETAEAAFVAAALPANPWATAQ